MSDLPPITETEYGRLAAAMTYAFMRERHMTHTVTTKCAECGAASSYLCRGRPWHGREGTSMDGESGCTGGCEETRAEPCEDCRAAPRCAECGEVREPLLEVDMLPGGRAETEMCQDCYKALTP